MNGATGPRTHRRPDRGSDGRFQCFHGQRINVESVPRLPTFPARWVLEDPRRRPYFVFWTDLFDETTISVAIRMEPARDGILISNHRGEFQVGIVRRPLLGGRATPILYRCPSCQWPRRYLYLAVRSYWPP